MVIRRCRAEITFGDNGIKKALCCFSKGLTYFKLKAYLQQLSGLEQVAGVHFWPLGQLVQVVCLAFTFLGLAGTLAITDDAANRIASMLKLTFFMYFNFYC